MSILLSSSSLHTIPTSSISSVCLRSRDAALWSSVYQTIRICVSICYRSSEGHLNVLAQRNVCERHFELRYIRHSRREAIQSRRLSPGIKNPCSEQDNEECCFLTSCLTASTGHAPAPNLARREFMSQLSRRAFSRKLVSKNSCRTCKDSILASDVSNIND